MAHSRRAHGKPGKRTRAQIKVIQRDLNHYVKWARLGMTPIRVDGVRGPATRKRTREVKESLGYGRKKASNAQWIEDFLRQLHHPRRPINDTNWARTRVRRGKKRRRARRRAVARNHVKAVFASGVTRFDGVPCAKWMVPYLQYARNNGWQGRLVSGWRDPVYSEGLCFRMCGAPSCSGRCAGRASNHSGSARPRGALDVSFYVEFGAKMRQCPLSPRLFNALGARDPVHYSASGR
jgi:hypothetical protein